MRGGNLKNILHVLLIVFAVSAYAQDNFSSSQASNLPSDKAVQTKWEVQGRIGNTVVVVNGRGDTSAVEVGSEIEGCLVTVRKVVCDTAEKEAIKNNYRQMKEVEVLTVPTPKINALVSILESSGKSGYSPDLGGIKFVIAEGKLIVRVARRASYKAKTLLGKAILEEVQDNGHVYYALDKNVVQVNYKRE